MKNLPISGINLDIIWKNPAQNRAEISAKLANIDADIIVLPEMFTTGFCMDAAEIAEDTTQTLIWMEEMAKKHQKVICGSVSTKENGQFYNRFYWVEPSGNHHFYDKKHLFSFSGEDQIYTAGKDRVIVTYQNCRILLQICFDLRFPVFARNRQDYDLILYVANWPESRIDAWNTLLKARAIENQCYVFGVNRIGTDGNQLHYPASSYCFFADGSQISTEKDHVISADIDLEKLQNFREKFPFLKNADDFTLQKTD